MTSSSWALTQLSHILPLDHDSLQQMLDYTSTLSKDAAADHLKDILGDSPKALEFISSYNSRRQAPPVSPKVTPETSTAVPHSHTKKRGKAPINKLPAVRQVENHGNTQGAYQKKDEEDYMAGRRKPQHRDEPALANTLALSDKPAARQLPKFTTDPSLKPPPAASGPLISDLPNVRTSSRASSRTSSPAPKTTISIAGGPSMHGASTTLQDLDSAIRTLELQTNPSLASASSSVENTSARACACNATRHALLTAAPNCLSCGKIICVKEGIGPCTFCGTPLLSSAEVTSMIESLKQERGQERMLANNNAASSQRRADISAAPRPFAPPSVSPSSKTPSQTQSGTASPSSFGNTTNPTAQPLDLAKAHRDRLLTYQSQNARRTRIHDEAADYDTPTTGLSQWSSPLERARQLKRQQKVLREQEWNARPNYEKRKVVVSVDLVGGKVVKRMADIEGPRKGVGEEEEEVEEEEEGNGGFASKSSSGGGSRGAEKSASASGGGGGRRGRGTFSKNPLMGNLIRPVWKKSEATTTTTTDSTNPAVDGDADADANPNKENTIPPPRDRQPLWRRVQDDNENDNEAVILDGGVYGGQDQDQRQG